MSRLKSPEPVAVLVNQRGPVPAGASEYARAKMLAAIAHVGPPVLAVRAKLTQAANPSASRPAIAQAVVDVNGHPVRAHCAADTMFEAVDLLQERLTARLAGGGRHHRRDRRTGGGTTGPSGVNPAPGHRPGPYLPAVEEPRVARRRAHGPGRQTPEDAVIDMESAGCEFWLFTDTTSGADCVVYRQGAAGGHRVASATGGDQQYEAGPLLSVSSAAAPVCGVGEAVERLLVTGLAFVFFVDSATGRGCVLHPRHDGSFDLVTPAR